MEPCALVEKSEPVTKVAEDNLIDETNKRSSVAKTWENAAIKEKPTTNEGNQVVTKLTEDVNEINPTETNVITKSAEEANSDSET